MGAVSITRDEMRQVAQVVAEHMRGRVVGTDTCRHQTSQILAAIEGVKAQTDRIPVIEMRMAAHEGEHRGREAAAAATAPAEANRLARMGAVAKWGALALTVITTLVLATLWVVERIVRA